MYMKMLEAVVLLVVDIHVQCIVPLNIYLWTSVITTNSNCNVIVIINTF